MAGNFLNLEFPIEKTASRCTLTSVNRLPTKARAALLGIGLDHQDGHRRITTAEQFAVVGGSSETHERMTETLLKTFEHLKNKGQALEATETRELAEILQANTPR